MRVIITGATGFIGVHLCQLLVDAKYEVIALTRNAKNAAAKFDTRVKCVHWDAETSSGWQDIVEGAFAIINLAGANIAGKYWTTRYKNEIITSRVNASKAIVQAFLNAKVPPAVLLQGSATGFYGHRGNEILDENSTKGAEGFLVEVVEKWESAVKKIAEMDVRVAYLRTGVVLGNDGGIIKKLKLPFKFFVGGAPGSGQQWISWIHLEDEAKIIKYLLENETAAGVYNLVSPEPVRMQTFCREMGKVMRRPAWVPIPEFALKMLMGKMAEETALASQRILPKRLLEAGYKFSYPSLKPALQDLL